MSQNKWQQLLALPFAVKVSKQMKMEPKWLASNVSQQMAATSGIAIWHKGKKANENGIKMACIQCHKTNGSNIWYCHLPSRLVRKWQWNLNGLQPISQTNGVNIWHCRLPSSLVRKLNPNDLHPMPQNKWQQLLALPYTIEDSKQMTMVEFGVSNKII